MGELSSDSEVNVRLVTMCMTGNNCVFLKAICFLLARESNKMSSERTSSTCSSSRTLCRSAPSHLLLRRPMTNPKVRGQTRTDYRALPFFTLLFIHSFIHIEHLYSAPSRKLLRSAPNTSMVKQSSLKVRKNAGERVLLKM